jgi:hypothetical protein
VLRHTHPVLSCSAKAEHPVVTATTVFTGSSAYADDDKPGPLSLSAGLLRGACLLSCSAKAEHPVITATTAFTGSSACADDDKRWVACIERWIASPTLAMTSVIVAV